MVVDPFSVVGILILVIILAFARKILHFLFKVFVIIAIIFLVMILLFGVSLDQVISWVYDLLLLAF